MSCFEQNFDTPTDFNTRTIYLDVSEFFDCIGLEPCCDCNICPPDKMYFVPGDQFIYNFNTKIQAVKIVNPSDGTELADKTETWKTGDKQITVDTNDTSGYKCFIVKIVKEDESECCLCFVFEEIACQKSFLIEGVYDAGERDCFGNLYGSGYSNQMRILGTVIHDNYDHSVETNQNDEATEKTIRRLFNVESLQFYEQNGFLIRHLQEVILMSDKGIIITFNDGTQEIFDFYDGSGLSSNTPDFSKKWLPKFTLRSQKCEKIRSCNS